MRNAFLVATCLLLSSPALAQVANADLVAVGSQNCPVAASAERGAPGLVVQTRKADTATAQTKLFLHIMSSDNKRLADVTVVLHGSDAQPRTELAGSASGSNLTEEFHLSGVPDHDLYNASVSPVRVANVRWVSITSIRFADGTVWHPSSNSYCRIQPNGFLRVTANGAK